MSPVINDLPGFRRRIRIVPGPGRVSSDLEDDYHCMGIVLHHANGIATRVEAKMHRVPWTTCPGAPAVVERTFTGAPLDRFVRQGGKLSNCTHLYDLALLAAAHAATPAPIQYDILVSDPVDDVVRAELLRDGVTLQNWTLRQGMFQTPASVAGLRLDQISPWIAAMDRAGQEAARLLRWGAILAHGRAMAFEKRSDKSRLPLGQCYTFQPENAGQASYITGTVRDFSRGGVEPLGTTPTVDFTPGP
jgi:hypothetical protein